ncbi:dUTP diphosphatase, partial [Escherichia coli]|nr:dUTP diphosphatase [Escherichia coli]
MINVKVKRLHPGAKLPFYATAGSAAMDFEAVEITPCVDSNGAISS